MIKLTRRESLIQLLFYSAVRRSFRKRGQRRYGDRRRLGVVLD
jgi:hypothetical protein